MKRCGVEELASTVDQSIEMVWTYRWIPYG